ncbi:MAG: EAL domain-containing protein [Thiobacillus sp.]
MFRLTLPDRSRVSQLALVVGLTALAYVLAAWFSQQLPVYLDAAIPTIWLATGVAAMACLRWGWAGVAGVLLGALAFHSTHLTLDIALRMAVGTALGAAIMSLLPRAMPPFSATLDYIPSVAKFALLAAPVGCAVSAASVVFSQPVLSVEIVSRALWSNWLAELLGVYLLTPLLLTGLQGDILPSGKGKRVEGLALVLAMLLLTLLMMRYAQPLRPAEIVLFVLLPAVLWAALRFSVAGVSLAIFLAALVVMAVVVAAQGGGDPVTAARERLALQISLVAMALSGLFVAAALAERRYSEVRLDMLANHDPLTGLPNRSYFQDFLSHTLARAQREAAQVSLLFIDLDRFKHINDSQGHEVGDRVLGVVANRLDEQLRADDFVARLGGDEFAVILMHPPASRAAARVAKKLSEALSEPFKLDQRRYAISASIGISVYPDDAPDANTLLRQADLAMYRAKQQRSTFEYFSDDMNMVAQQMLTLETGLRQALERDELVLVYQPKVDLVSGQVIGTEALIRWLTRAGTIVGPDQFIPVAEETGLIVPIGRWVVKRACEQWMAWQASGLNPPPVAVNLSPRQFNDARLLDDIDAALLATGMAASNLQLEITESAAMENPSRTFDMLNAMRERGLSIYIDDFGTGHSNLSKLKRMPIDALKIDKSLVHDVLTDSDDAEIAHVIIQLAHALNLRVVAEGVETAEQAVFLKQRGCDEIQGYLLAKPLPPDKVSVLFAQSFRFG